MVTGSSQRVFWLGMHKVLSATELPRLRRLGYEVYAPPYLSDIADQSAVRHMPDRQQSTLPAEVFDQLTRTNFFYSTFTAEVGALLNQWFDCVIVTINPDWLVEVLKVYTGKVIYRVYGQPYVLSDHITHAKQAQGLINGRPNFFFVPHLAETAAIEAPWMTHRMRIVPYALGYEILDYADTWASATRSGEVGLLCPRIDVPYYLANYGHIKNHFVGPTYPIFGIQFEKHSDPQVVGEMQRRALLNRFRRMNGFIYHYREPTVSYLPPLEMMVIGGPVIFFADSLLGRLFEPGAPGAMRDEAHGRNLAERLLGGDDGLAREMIASQERPRRLYHPDHVWPAFDAAFREMLDEPVTERAKAAQSAVAEAPGPSPRRFRPPHINGLSYQAVRRFVQSNTANALGLALRQIGKQ